MQVEQGQLRRFTSWSAGWHAGDIFLVLKVVQPHSARPREVTFLVGGRIEEGWGFPWIMLNSEVIDEAG